MDEFLRALLNAPIREQVVVMGGAAIALALGFGFIGATFGAYFGGRIGARRAVTIMRREQPALPAAQQLDEIRNALDAIAVEVERISEGQRFTARLVTERVNQGSLGATHRRDAGPVTPH